MKTQKNSLTIPPSICHDIDVECRRVDRMNPINSPEPVHRINPPDIDVERRRVDRMNPINSPDPIECLPSRSTKRYQRRCSIALSALSIVAIAMASSCTAEVRGLDSDGDGLSDEQERMFCTDPHTPDTDGDTIPDALDPSPCDKPKINVVPTVVSTVSTETQATATVQIAVRDANGRWIDDDTLEVRTTFGELTPLTKIGTGIFEISLSSSNDGAAEVTFSLMHANVSETILVELKLKKETSIEPNPDNPDPEKPTPEKPDPEKPTPSPESSSCADFVLTTPGVNPGIYANSGKMDGKLIVAAVDGQSLNWSDSALRAKPGAYVQVDLGDGSVLHGTTDDNGCVAFEDERLKGEVTVTIGAQKARYVTMTHIDARVIVFPLISRDIAQKDAKTEGAKVTGTVRGFWGETGLPTLPPQNTNVFGTINIAIVQAAIRNMPLSSMNTGSILRPPNGESVTAELFDIPPNLVLSNKRDPSLSRFSLDKLEPGKYLIFALAGAGGNILAASQNPYELKFKPMALGIKEIEVRAGETVDIDLPLQIDLRTNTDDARLHFGQLPPDPKTGQALPMGLVLPMIRTGKGYIFLDVNSEWNLPNFSNPISLIFPRAVDEVLTSLGLSVDPMVVGLAARRAVSGFDLPGISTRVSHIVFDKSSTATPAVYMNDGAQWPSLPKFVTPEPPQSEALDAVGGNLYPSRKIAWEMKSDADLTILRLNYMTPPIHNKILNSDIGASQAHLLWEIYVPSPYREVVLPSLSEQAPDYPVLVNYEPTTKDAAYQYDETTIELEINAYYMGPKHFDYERDFCFEDVNIHSLSVSQDSYLISVK